MFDMIRFGMASWLVVALACGGLALGLTLMKLRAVRTYRRKR